MTDIRFFSISSFLFFFNIFVYYFVPLLFIHCLYLFVFFFFRPSEIDCKPELLNRKRKFRVYVMAIFLRGSDVSFVHWEFLEGPEHVGVKNESNGLRGKRDGDERNAKEKRYENGGEWYLIVLIIYPIYAVQGATPVLGHGAKGKMTDLTAHFDSAVRM